MLEIYILLFKNSILFLTIVLVLICWFLTEILLKDILSGFIFSINVFLKEHGLYIDFYMNLQFL